jgi:pentose-5-phosphate-3-epimerase
MPVRINPSILSADFVNLERDIARIATADLVHVDVMDNHFVPNLTFGPQMVSRIQAVSTIPLDVHLMIENPDRWAPGYAELGAHTVTFHAEAAQDAVARSGLDVWLQVDGGIDERTIAIAAEAGADTFVAGSSVYGAGEPAENIAALRAAAMGHAH